ncbi:MAG: DNA repair protein RecN [Lachnospiraceae bacterium]|nr:DNA repair protein RecN [Lachnospiraceae bacterium]
MLINLHVHNFALIDDVDIEFGPGLNILTGETGTGKSILIDAVNAALGGRMRKDPIRGDGCRIDLTFSVDNDRLKEALEEEGIRDTEGTVILSRRILGGHSIFRINDEASTAARVRRAAELLIDIHGQQENASLCRTSRQLELIDRYAGPTDEEQRAAVAAAYRRWKACSDAMEEFSRDEEQRIREQDLLEYEVKEIDDAALSDGEEEQLSAVYKKYSNSRKLTELLSWAEDELSGAEGAAESLSRAVRSISSAAGIDDGISPVLASFESVESELSDALRGLADYVRGLEYDPSELVRIEERLDLIHRLQRKYGRTINDILEALEKKRERLVELQHFDERRLKAEKELSAALAVLREDTLKLSKIRREAAACLSSEISDALADLGFLSHDFEISFKNGDDAASVEPAGRMTANGADEVEYLIRSNPGEPLLPVAQIASGGELSRIMLAMKAVLAERDEIPSLIFDEIDAGISGRTAQRVSEKLHAIGVFRQVICITHLPQIAAMADRHFRITKEYDGDRTSTKVRLLEEGETTEELARLLGGAELTETVYRSAVEMKELAKKVKDGFTAAPLSK